MERDARAVLSMPPTKIIEYIKLHLLSTALASLSIIAHGFPVLVLTRDWPGIFCCVYACCSFVAERDILGLACMEKETKMEES